MKHVIACGFLLLTGACAVPEHLPPQVPGQTAAAQAGVSHTADADGCMKRAAKRIDDRTKPASDVAAAVAASCQGQSVKAAQAATAGLDPASQQAIMARLTAQSVGAAGRIVTDERRRHPNAGK